MSTNKSQQDNDMQRNRTDDAQQLTDAAFSDETGDTSPPVSDMQRFRDEVKEANDRALRAQAELENFRKRMRREMDDERRYAAMALISELLPVIDNLDRAIDSSDSSQEGDGLLAGVKMVQAQFLSVLERHHCRRIGIVGETFDPSRHQAIAQESSDEHPAGTVMRIAVNGYQLHDRIVRPAQVFVSSGPGGADKTSN